MPIVPLTDEDRRFLRVAYEEARMGCEEGGIAVGAAMVRDGVVLARGRNGLVQKGNPLLHGETACIDAYFEGLRNANKSVLDADLTSVTMYTSLSPCAMCTGTIILFGIPRVVIGEATNFPGEIDWLLKHGKDVAVANDPEMIAFFARFRDENADMFAADIRGYPKA